MHIRVSVLTEFATAAAFSTHSPQAIADPSDSDGQEIEAVPESPDGAGSQAEGDSQEAACAPKPFANGHWYAQMRSFNNAHSNTCASVGLYTTKRAHYGNAQQFVDHEMWYGLDGNGDYWVEVGVTDGTGLHQSVFWADKRANNGGYHEHFYPHLGWKLGTWYTGVSAGHCVVT